MIMSIVLTSIFVLVYACTVAAFEQTELRDVKYVLALAVGVLCVLSLGQGEAAPERPLIGFVLIPYATLACTLILLPLLWLISVAYCWVRKVQANWRKQAENERRECRLQTLGNKKRIRSDRIAAQGEIRGQTKRRSIHEVRHFD